MASCKMNRSNLVFCVLYLCSSSFILTKSVRSSCPPPCHCTKNEKHAIVSINCNNAGLFEIPRDLPDTLLSLLLRKNSITSINQFSLTHLPKLETLDLSENRLTFLTDGCFKGLSSLTKLLLQHNNITYNVSTIPTGVFQDLKKLKILNIQDNCDSYRTNASYPDDSLSDLISLEELHIDGLHDKDFGLGFQKLSSLRLLNLTGGEGFRRCGIENLTETLFENFIQRLRYIDFSNCQISHVHPMAFSKLSSLNALDFTDNHHMGIGGVENISHSLTFNNVEVLILSYIYRPPDFHHFDLRASSFRFFPNTSLTVLDLSSNNIEYIEPEVINYLPQSLKTFSLRDNSIHDAKFLRNLHKLDKLITFDLSHQLKYRSTLELEANVMKFHPNMFSSSRSIDDEPVLLPPLLENIYGSDMKIEYPVPPLRFSSNNVKILDFSFNSLPAWLGPWYGLHSLLMLNLSYNNLELIRPTSFGDMRSLTTLLLAGNRIGNTINQDKQSLTFSNQTSLEILDLSHNAIRTLPKYIFVSLKKLKTLSLRNNSFVSVDFHLAEMKLLRVLDLSQNQLTHISPDFRKGLDFILNNHNISIQLAGNILSCSCEFLDFLMWIRAKKNMISDFDMLVCTYKSSTVTLANLDHIVEEMKYGCVGDTIVISCCAAFVAILLLLSIPAIIYHKRWKIRYLYYMGPKKTNPYRQVEQQATHANAYISFPDSLRHFVINKLYPELTRRGLILSCFEDITPGTSETKAIIESIQQCDKTVVLFADDYLKNRWNTFELHMAIQEGIYTRREIVIPVVIGKLHRSDAHPDIMAYLKSNKCIPYQNEEHEDKFWDYLAMRITQ